MNGIKMKDCKFYVDKDARTIVCVISNTGNMVLDFINDHFRWSDIDFWAGSQRSLDRKIRMPYSFAGKAVCAPEDEWNEELGKLIAFSRAKEKCYKSFFKRANLFIQTFDRRLDHATMLFNEFYEKLDNKKTTLEKAIEDRIQKE